MTYYTDALKVERELGNKLGVARALHNLGELEESEGKAERAALCFCAAEQLFTDIGSPWASYSSFRCESKMVG